MKNAWIHYVAIITRPIFLEVFTIDTLLLALMGELWGVFCEFEISYMFYVCHYIIVTNIM